MPIRYGRRVTEDEILRFVEQAFHSVWPLELLAVLCQRAEQLWSTDTLSREIRANDAVVIQGLQVLEAAGLVVIDQLKTFRFQPQSAELAELGNALIDLYTRKPRTVMRAIFSKPQDRMQTFSDAFIIRKDPC